MKSDLDRKVFLEVDKYVYQTSWLVGTLTRLGHRVCSIIREFDRPNSLVVDLGCGPGNHFRYIKYSNFIGLDSMPEMVSRASETVRSFPNGRVVEGSILDMPFEDGSVDSAIASGVLEHFADLEEVLLGIKRVLRDGGELLVLQPSQGFLYGMGRKLTTGRHIKRKLGINYGDYLKKEKELSCKYILDSLGRHFTRKRLVGIPFIVPYLSLNAFIVGRYVKDG